MQRRKGKGREGEEGKKERVYENGAQRNMLGFWKEKEEMCSKRNENV